MAIVTLLVLWYSMTFFFPAVGLDLLSPGNLLSNVPDIIKGAWSLGDWETVVGFVAISGASTALSSSVLLHEGHLKERGCWRVTMSDYSGVHKEILSQL